MSRIAFIILLSLSAYATCFGQSSFKGLTPVRERALMSSASWSELLWAGDE